MERKEDVIGKAIAADPEVGLPAGKNNSIGKSGNAAITTAGAIGADFEKLAEATGVTDPAMLKLIFEQAQASLTASHTAEIKALREEIADVRSSSEREGKVVDLNESMGGYPWMYFRIPETFPDKTRRGWITMGPGGASPKSGHRDTGSFQLYVNKGFIPITNRGLCPVPVSSDVPKAFKAFVEHGGAADFPPSQIIAYQWHRNNPFAKMGVRWAQLDSIIDKLTSWTCDFCGYQMDFMPNDPSAGTAYRVHLTNADKVTFREAVETVKAAGLTTTPFKARSIDEMTAMIAP